MIDVRRLRANPDEMRRAIRLRRVDLTKADLDRWLALDDERRRLRAAIDQCNAERNSLGQLGRTDPDAARARGQELRRRGREMEEQFAAVTQEWQRILDWFPNWPHPEMPEGADEADNVEECAWIPGAGYVDRALLGRGAQSASLMPRTPCHAGGAAFTPLHHVELGERLGGIDIARASTVSGSRFAYLLGDIAQLQFALHQVLVDKLLSVGFTPIIPPLLVRERALYGTSHFPEGREQVYAIESQNVEEHTQLFLVGSSEPANFGYFADRVLDEADLPIRLFAATPCFRSEAGAWGRDVRGLKRVHQFDKIEMNAVCTPAQSEAIYDEFRAINEWLLQTLELPYRIVDKCGGDAGYLATHRQRDVEVWLSGQREFMEVMTDTNTTDYQARRLNIRYCTTDGQTVYCHTVNDTGCAMGRMLIAILDNYQQPDGAVKVPRALRPLLKKDELRPRGSGHP
jgi:seryl-tRNA synthetase